jgi:anion-transporting  ArsA/GET3 family ATPase
VNGVIVEPEGDFMRKRMEMQSPYLRMLEEEYGGKNLVRVPLLPYEVKGLERLKEIERVLFAR